MYVCVGVWIGKGGETIKERLERIEECYVVWSVGVVFTI